MGGDAFLDGKPRSRGGNAFFSGAEAIPGWGMGHSGKKHAFHMAEWATLSS